MLYECGGTGHHLLVLGRVLVRIHDRRFSEELPRKHVFLVEEKPGQRSLPTFVVLVLRSLLVVGVQQTSRRRRIAQAGDRAGKRACFVTAMPFFGRNFLGLFAGFVHEMQLLRYRAISERNVLQRFVERQLVVVEAVRNLHWTSSNGVVHTALLGPRFEPKRYLIVRAELLGVAVITDVFGGLLGIVFVLVLQAVRQALAAQIGLVLEQHSAVEAFLQPVRRLLHHVVAQHQVGVAF